MIFSTCNLKIGKPMLCCFFFQTQHRFLHKKHILYYINAITANLFKKNNSGNNSNGNKKGHFKIVSTCDLSKAVC